MLPYFEIHTLPIGPLTIQIWGLMVSLGILAGLSISYYLAKKYFLSTNVLLDVAIWSIVGALIGGRLFYFIFYYFLAQPLDILKFWQGGASSLGGFVGAGLAMCIFVKRRHFSFNEFLPYLDIGVVGLWLGWGIGRLGCFLIHDHPGRLTNTFLAINFSTGPRYDLGLLESMLGFTIFIIFLCLFKYLVGKRWGLVAFYSFGLYVISRFFLDFLRAEDLIDSNARYFNLTVVQWGMGVIFLGLTVWLILGNIRRSKLVKKAVIQSEAKDLRL